MLMLLPVHHASGIQTNALIKMWLGHCFLTGTHTWSNARTHTKTHKHSTKQEKNDILPSGIFVLLLLTTELLPLYMSCVT